MEFPEVVLVDSTHGKNANRYKLFSFVVQYVFRKGQYAHHVLVYSEQKDDLRHVVKSFKENNPVWSNIRLFMTDKTMHDKNFLREEFPEARQLLCQWHAITWKQETRLTPDQRKDVKSIMRLLVYAKNPKSVTTTRGLGNDPAHELYKSFLTYWDCSKDEWVTYLHGGVPHLTNNTNNSI
ncbi:hypothetical protein PHMEG_00012933 [Phytophthora megakarya]|uniref:ZSWIM1/3 RNaseH-like domain-containing protein n=1 Tax=Phytophthora megakarya TaxID=4795 RepID=A0A225W7H0_9STRA|nr:hypothetical protein PHMEG_00012933 [Phytophthora megakarya]